MSKTNKELAVDIAIEYVHGRLHQSGSDSIEGFPVENCCKIIETVYNTLKKLDDKE